MTRPQDTSRLMVRILIRTLKNSPQAQTATLSDVQRWLNRFDGHHKQGSELNKFIVENTLADTATYEDYLGFTGSTPEK